MSVLAGPSPRAGVRRGRSFAGWAGGSAAALLVLLAAAVRIADAQSPSPARAAAGEGERPPVVVTTEVLGAVVRELVAGEATLTVLMESGADPHSWQPSARDAEAIFGADLVVANGLGLEEGLADVLSQASAEGVVVFEATDHLPVRSLDPEAPHHDDPGEAHGGAGDPHFWLDPLAMRDVVLALAPVLEASGVPTEARARELVAGLEALDAEVREILFAVPPERRHLVTGHESLGYLADRYGFTIVGTVLPGLTSTGDISARELSALIAAVRESGVPAIFTEVGTPRSVVEAAANEAGVRIVEVRDAQLPEGGSYIDLVRAVALTIRDGLSG